MGSAQGCDTDQLGCLIGGRLRNGKILRVTGVRELKDAGSVPREWEVPLGLNPHFATYCLCYFRPVTWPLRANFLIYTAEIITFYPKSWP